MKKNCKKIITPVIIAVLVGAFLVGGTVAYLTSTSDKVVNTFTPSKVVCDVVETFDGNIKSSIKISNKDVNDEYANTDEYIRLKLVSYMADAEGNPIGESALPVLPGEAPSAGDIENKTPTKFVLGSDWFYVESEDTYYYKHPVKYAESESGEFIPAFTSDFFKTDEEGNGIILTADETNGIYQVVEVFASAIQAKGVSDDDNTPAVTTEWGICLDPETKDLIAPTSVESN